jgi:hypothetical protein
VKDAKYWMKKGGPVKHLFLIVGVLIVGLFLFAWAFSGIIEKFY